MHPLSDKFGYKQQNNFHFYENLRIKFIKKDIETILFTNHKKKTPE